MMVGTVRMIKKALWEMMQNNDIEEWLAWQIMARMGQLRGQIVAARRFRGRIRVVGNDDRLLPLPKEARARFAQLLRDAARAVDEVLARAVSSWDRRGDPRWAAEILGLLTALDAILYAPVEAMEGRKISAASLLEAIAQGVERGQDVIYIDA